MSYTKEDHKKTKGGCCIYIKNNKRLQELIEYLYAQGFRYYNNKEYNTQQILFEFTNRNYMVIPNYYDVKMYPTTTDREQYDLHSRSGPESTWENKTIDEILEQTQTEIPGYIKIEYSDGTVYMDCVKCENAHDFYYKSSIDCLNDIVYTISSYFNDDHYISHSPMSKERIDWYKECIKEYKILDFPLKKVQVVKTLPVGYLCFQYEKGQIFADIKEWDEDGDGISNSLISLIDDYIDSCEDLIFKDYLSSSLMTEQQIEWYKECLKQNKILEFPMKKKENDLENDYYKFKNITSEYIIKLIDDRYYFIRKQSNYFGGPSPIGNTEWFKKYLITKASNDETEWMEACIKANKFVEYKAPQKKDVKIEDGYYNFSSINGNAEYIIKIQNDNTGFKHWSIELPNPIYLHISHTDTSSYYWLDDYYRSQASSEQVKWLDDCIAANKVVPMVKDNYTTYYQKDVQLNNITKDDVKSSYIPNIPKSIKSEVDDLIPIPKLEIKTTKITFINNKN